MTWNQPTFGKLGQQAWRPAHLSVVDLFKAPKNTLYNHPTAWAYLGRIQPGSYKNDFTRKMFDVITGIPETIKESFVVNVEAALEFELIESTGAAYVLASGNSKRIPGYGVSTTVGDQTQSTIEDVLVVTATGMSVGDEVEVQQGTSFDYSFIQQIGTPQIATPGAAPTLATANSGGSIANGVYLVKFTWYNALGQTLPSPESTSITTTGTNVSTITVTFGAIPTGATGAKIYVTAAGGATNTETFQVNATSGTNIVLTAAITPGAALPTDNTTGTLIRVWPRLTKNPVNTATVKRVAINSIAGGDEIIEHFALMAIGTLEDGSQIITWVPEAKVNSGIQDPFGDKKIKTLPLKIEAFGFTDPNYNGPIAGKKFILTPDLAIPYSQDGWDLQADWSTWSLTNCDVVSNPGFIQLAVGQTSGSAISPIRPMRTAGNLKTQLATYTTPGASTVTFNYRTSNDGTNWSSWGTLAAAVLSNYIQTQIVFTRPGSEAVNVDFLATYPV